MPTDFENLVGSIQQIDQSLRRGAVGAVNRMLTIRNWLIGRHLVEFEQDGADRAQYGNKLLRTLSDRLRAGGAKGMSFTNLNLFRQFYRTYPQMGLNAAHMLGSMGIGDLPGIIQEPAEQFDRAHQPVDNNGVTGNDLPKEPIGQEPAGQFRKPDTDRMLQKPSAKSQSFFNQGVITDGESENRLLRHFSFTHFVELMRIDDPVKRAFYETGGIKGAWSVPQLKRQIESLLYERTGMSKDKAGLVEAVNAENRMMTIEDTIRDPYVLEFTGFPEQYQYSEADLETALLNHIQSFLLELGTGFCFEARQKRITLDNEHDRIDLVFYHRILRCHVLIDLKVRKFRHADAGQMNFYLNYYKEEVMAEGDNPPVGLVLCTDRDETRVKYATAGMDGSMFVSKYLTVLPSEENLVRFLEDDRDRTENVLRERMAEYQV